MNNTSDIKSAAKSARLVWLIVLLGLGTGGFTLCIVRAALNNIREQRNQLNATQDAMDDLSNDLQHGFDDTKAQLQRLLAGQTETQPTQQRISRMGESLNTFGTLLHGDEITTVEQGIQGFLKSLQSLHDQCAEWNKQNEKNLANLAEKKKAVDGFVLDMRAALSSAEGRHGLELASKIRHFRKLTGQPAQDEAGKIINRLGSNAEITEIPVEVSNLALLCQQLQGEDEIDHLADLKDNLFLASLSRLNRIVARSGATDPVLERQMTTSAEMFKSAVFGSGFVMDSDHQTILVEPDGLYSLCRQRLELRQSREALRAEVTRRSEEYAAIDQRLDALSNKMKDGITAKVQASLGSNWRDLLVVTLACGASLVVVGKIIATTIKRQIIVITEATADLQRSNAQMAAIHQTSLDCVLVLDSNWKIINFNPAAERAFKCTEREAIGKALQEFIIPPRTDDQQPVLHKLVEVSVKRPDGTSFPAEMAITAAVMDGPPLYIASLHDLTERKKADAEREELNDRLLKSSRHAGMAEVAIGVLHNVGNVLNSVNVSASVVANKLRQSEVSSLAKVSELIQSHPQDLGTFLTQDDRGKLVPGYIGELAQCLGQEQAAMLDEINSLAQGIEHIKQIVSAQQSLAKKGAMRIATEPAKLMETALTMQSGTVHRDDIEIVRRFEEIPTLQLDQHRIMQILVNLISNAKQAVKASGNSQKQICLVVETADNDQGKHIRFAVTDNGVGISPQHLTRIFSHGFTTKADGHGFGLHSAANAATEMGGTLTAASDGLGKGSTFTLELPVTANQTETLCKQ